MTASQFARRLVIVVTFANTQFWTLKCMETIAFIYIIKGNNKREQCKQIMTDAIVHITMLKTV